MPRGVHKSCSTFHPFLTMYTIQIALGPALSMPNQHTWGGLLTRPLAQLFVSCFLGLPIQCEASPGVMDMHVMTSLLTVITPACLALGT